MDTIYLFVTIDTEEDAWGIPSCSCLTDEKPCPVENIYSLPKVQKIFDEFAIRPVYLCNAPVLEDQRAIELLRNFLKQNRCDIGSHIHPWNTHPISEEIIEVNTHLKNLSPSLIKKKLTNITDAIKTNFDINPIIFRAGRWGMNADVLKILIKLGYKIDTSVTPYTDWSEYANGADFTGFPDRPYYINLAQGISKPASKYLDLLEIPVSIGFNRACFPFWNKVYTLLKRPLINKLRLAGLLHRTGLLQKIWLSPEFNNAREMISLSKILLQKGNNLLNLTFHSTSLSPGKNPFVRSEADLVNFISRIRDYLSWLNSHANIISPTSAELLDHIDQRRIVPCTPEQYENFKKRDCCN